MTIINKPDWATRTHPQFPSTKIIIKNNKISTNKTEFTCYKTRFSTREIKKKS